MVEHYAATFPILRGDANLVDLADILPFAEGVEPEGYWLILGPELTLIGASSLNRADFLSSEGEIHRVAWAELREFAQAVHQSIDAIYALMLPGTTDAADAEFVETLQSPSAVFTVRFEDSTLCTVSCADPARLRQITSRFADGS